MRLLSTLAVAAAAFMAVPASAAPIFAENFEGYSASHTPWDGAGSWTTGNSVDIVKSGEFGLTCAGGSGNCVDLNGTPGPGSMSKTISGLTAGVEYTLSFLYTGNQLGAQWPEAGFNVSIGSLSDNIGPLANTSNVFKGFSAKFIATGNDTLTFQHLGGNDYRGSILDNISIGVPEPSTWAMLILGFGLIGTMMRRRPRQSVSTRLRFA